MTDRTPLDVGELVRRLGSNPPLRLLDVARGFLGAADKIEAVNLLLIDYGQELLRPFGAYQGPPLGQERVHQGEAGVAYRTRLHRRGRHRRGVDGQLRGPGPLARHPRAGRRAGRP